MEKEIKDYREKELRAYVIGNIILILIGTGMLDNIFLPMGEVIPWGIVNALLNSAILSSVIYIYVFIADSLIPGRIKEKLLWPCNGMPGERVFIDIREKNVDSRFESEDALERYTEIYKRIDSEKGNAQMIQNSNWYKLMKAHENKSQIYISHRDFLLSRDMFFMSFWILIGFVGFQAYVIYHMNQSFSICNLVIILLEIIITWFVARDKGKRFVYNVIALDLAIKKNTKKC